MIQNSLTPDYKIKRKELTRLLNVNNTIATEIIVIRQHITIEFIQNSENCSPP